MYNKVETEGHMTGSGDHVIPVWNWQTDLSEKDYSSVS